MSNEIITGRGADLFVLLGATLESVNARVVNFLNNILSKRIMFESLVERVGSLGDTQHQGKIKKEKYARTGRDLEIMEKELTDINSMIEDINQKILPQMNTPNGVALVDIPLIKSLIESRLKNYPSDRESLALSNENLKMKIVSHFEQVNNSIHDVFNYFREKEMFEGLDNLNNVYRKGIFEAVHIYSIGYEKTAILCAGRTIEGAINDYLRELFKKKKISKEKYEELIEGRKSDHEERFGPKYQNKIGFLKGSQFLTEEEFADLLSFSFKRNRGGHPDLGEIDNKRARTLIQQGIWLSIDLQNRIKDLNGKT